MQSKKNTETQNEELPKTSDVIVVNVSDLLNLLNRLPETLDSMISDLDKSVKFCESLDPTGRDPKILEFLKNELSDLKNERQIVTRYNDIEDVMRLISEIRKK